MIIKEHPTLGVIVREDGTILAPDGGRSRGFHWTFGCPRPDGYLVVSIRGRQYLVHRLVAETFIGPIPEGHEIDHINRDRSDNSADNLRIVSHRENCYNTSLVDASRARYGMTRREDPDRYRRTVRQEYWRQHPEKMKEQTARQLKRCRSVRFSDGKSRFAPRESAALLLVLPVAQRVFQPKKEK